MSVRTFLDLRSAISFKEDLNFLNDIDAQNEDGTDISSYLQTIDDSTSTIKGHVKISIINE